LAVLRDSVGSLIFPITGSPDHLIFQQPSACVLQPATHPGVDVLLQIQAQVPFDRPVTDRSMPFFSVFPGYNQAQFQLCFLIFTVGRERVVGCSFNLANYPIWGISYFSFFKELFGH
jgi:hypothetical protein